MYKFHRLAAAAGLSLAMSAAGAFAKDITVSYSHQANFDSEIHTAAWVFQKYAEEKLPGLTIKLYGNNQLGQERDVYEAMQLGTGATCVISGTAILNNFSKRTAVLDLPFLWKNYEHVHRVLDGEVGQKLAAELEQRGFKVVAWMDSWGYRNVVSAKKVINSAADLKGLKVRTIPTKTYVAALNAMGANATPMAFGEVYQSLETGVLDGFEHGASAVVAQKFYEVAKHVALTRHLFGPLVMACAKRTWDGLTAQEKAAVTEAAIMARDVQRALAPVREAEAFDVLRKKGMTIKEIDTTPMAQAAAKVQDELAAEAGASELLAIIRKTN
ncbi:TRAP transporter substrate-binding protein [Xanthobacteraceae bacterium Astr-EGSB]|uniref:TRAP transporter substrate-binding protein n=1 Tax=Astrobacterium formosum TaxID=3069710 RepID=UPI0027B4E0D3|nr:TRAP transporter substrate-binding protein [Xanthobacteraceae bacterium Astr-EGSB]